jgi:hypothetical protein
VLVRKSMRGWSSPCGTHGGRQRLGARVGRRPAGFIAVHKAVRKVFLRTKGTKSWHGPRHGRSTAGWAATHGGQSPTKGGATRVRRRRRWVAGAAGVSTWRTGRGSERRFDTGGPTTHGLAGSRLPRRSDPRGGGHGERA